MIVNIHNRADMVSAKYHLIKCHENFFLTDQHSIIPVCGFCVQSEDGFSFTLPPWPLGLLKLRSQPLFRFAWAINNSRTYSTG